jgi:hypothetical protein
LTGTSRKDLCEHNAGDAQDFWATKNGDKSVPFISASSLEELKEYVHDQLPFYMMPSAKWREQEVARIKEQLTTLRARLACFE